MSTTQPICLINQSACGRIEGNPVCPKCGIDDRVVYPGQGDLEVALASAATRYLSNEQMPSVIRAKELADELTVVRNRAMSVNYRRFKLEVLGFDLLMTLIGVPLFFVLWRKFNWNAILEVGGGGVIASIWLLFLCLSGLLQFIVDFRKFKNEWHDPLLCYRDLASAQQKNKLSKYSATHRFLSACAGIADGIPKARETGS